MLSFIMDVLFPARNHCLLCGKESEDNGSVCKGCEDAFVTVGLPACPECGRFWTGSAENTGKPREKLFCNDCLSGENPYFAARSLGPYGGVLKEGIYQFKYQGHRALAGFFGLLLADLFLKESGFYGTNVIIPVPLSPQKARERGFNQSELLARKLGSLLSIPVQNCLVKTRHTPSQSKLTRLARQKNVAGAYRMLPQMMAEVQGKQVLLVDDIFTTGATVKECAEVLQRAGAREVGVMTLAAASLEKKACPE